MEEIAGGKAMKNNGCELGIAGKRHHREEEEEGDVTVGIDRLSILPEPILSHILSLLDTKSAVQTCVLSRLWRFTWKDIAVLNFRRDSFLEYRSFRRFVGKVMSLRNSHNAHKVSYTDDEGSEDRDRSRLIMVIQYAASYNAEHLVINLEDYAKESFRFSELFGLFVNSNLKTLVLRGVDLDRGFESHAFRLLKTLDLERCMLSCCEEWDPDPFSKFPCLENLVLNDSLCLHGRLKISGLHLLTLKLIETGFSKIEIFAPELKFFSLHSEGELEGFSSFSLPSLDHAYIEVCEPSVKRRNVLVKRHLVSLFQGLCNARSLALHHRTTLVLSEFDEFLEQQPSPFTRLKSLFLESSCVPYNVRNYFLKGPTVQPKVESMLRVGLPHFATVFDRWM